MILLKIDLKIQTFSNIPRFDEYEPPSVSTISKRIKYMKENGVILYPTTVIEEKYKKMDNTLLSLNYFTFIASRRIPLL